MEKRAMVTRLALSGLLLGCSVAATACAYYDLLKAKKAFKDANQFYQAQDYRRAAAAYEEVLKYKEALAREPILKVSYFYLGNSYDLQYKPGRQGEPENDALLQKAIENYKLAAELVEEPNIKRLALQYLVAAYGPDKLNDPDQAEPIVKRMIELDPQDPTNYFALAKLYEDVGRYEEAEQALQQARERRPNDPAVYLQLAGFYNRQGEFEKTIAALEERAKIEPNNPEAYYTIGTYYWEKAFRDFRLTDAQKRDYVMKGLAAVDKALALKSDYTDAMVYKNILLRLQANLEKDPAKQKALIAEADRLRDKAQELRKQKAAGVGD
jgi:tetratricopeptide (TPR) repeat protein